MLMNSLYFFFFLRQGLLLQRRLPTSVPVSSPPELQDCISIPSCNFEHMKNLKRKSSYYFTLIHFILMHLSPSSLNVSFKNILFIFCLKYQPTCSTVICLNINICSKQFECVFLHQCAHWELEGPSGTRYWQIFVELLLWAGQSYRHCWRYGHE